ncbi:MAG: transketolase subunit [Segetibacter sp.]|nr:transketolase subunit [Segetibacter sp.]
MIDPKEVRKTILEMLYRAGASHLGSNMSVVEMLIAMYSSVDCDKIISKSNDRSRIFISKGHCAAATYATMAYFNIIPFELLETYHQDNSLLTGHVSHEVTGVEHSTGALGHGLNVAVGSALGLKSRNVLDARVLVLCGDGEIQEGSIWEGLMFAVHKKLNNLCVLIDNNGISSITATHDVIDLRPLVARFEGFGLNVYEVAGHNVSEIQECISKASEFDIPTVIICNTVKGKDVPFAEGEPVWHYRSLTGELFNEALTFLNNK